MSSQSDRLIAEMDEFLIQRPAIPVVIARGHGVEVEDVDGITYLDCNAGPGVLAAGHTHAEIVETMREQAGILSQSSGMCYTEPLGQLARKLAELAPGDLKRSFFCNSGAEANEGAIKLAKRAAAKRGLGGNVVIALQHSFHGRLALATALSGAAQGKRGLGNYALFPGVTHIPAPYCYRCPYNLTYPDCNLRCANALEEAITDLAAGDAGVFIMEPIIGTGGMIVPPEGYLKRIEAICHKYGLTLVMDEVFAGMGRTGKLFAFEHENILPDIVTIAKALGGGLPLAAFLARDEIGQAFEPGDHYTTFGWNNAFTLTVALKGMQVMEKEALIENAGVVGAELLNGLRDLQEDSRIMGDVRGKGLFIGIEIVQDRKTREPGPDLARALWTHLREKEHLLCGVIGTYKNVVRLTPPLSIKREEVQQVLNRFTSALHAVEANALY